MIVVSCYICYCSMVLGTQECAISPFTNKELLFVLANAELQNADRN